MTVSPGRLASLAVAALLMAGPAAAQYYPLPPGYYPPPPPPPVFHPNPYAVPQPYPAPPPYYTPAPRPSRNAVAEQCATQFGTCQTGPTRPGRRCNCFFPGSGKIPGVAVQ